MKDARVVFLGAAIGLLLLAQKPINAQVIIPPGCMGGAAWIASCNPLKALDLTREASPDDNRIRKALEEKARREMAESLHVLDQAPDVIDECFQQAISVQAINTCDEKLGALRAAANKVCGFYPGGCKKKKKQKSKSPK